MSTQLSEFSANTVISATQGQLSSELDGESVILHLDSGIYYGLNEVGARIWALVQQPCSFSNLQRTLLEEYQVSEADCIQAVVNILRDLKRAGLIEVRDEKV
mgnify:CR=1 FL=1